MSTFALTDMTLPTIASLAVLSRMKLGQIPEIIAKIQAETSDPATLYMNLSRFFAMVGNDEFAQDLQARASRE